jgi:hypothetical protein
VAYSSRTNRTSDKSPKRSASASGVLVGILTFRTAGESRTIRQ